ncbi:Transcriptional regulator, GntR family protein [Minicystis rosea]|nr:Transcriptional regulator, GntR family protein [Minicystis rosea]
MGPKGEVKRVAHEILGRIVAGAYPAGLRLPAEADLATELSCGRSTVREALGHLAGLGVVKSRRGSGAMVLDFRREGTPALLPSYVMSGRFDRPAAVLARELLGVRTLLAAEAVRLAARYADRAALAEARALLARAPSLAHDPVAHGINELDFFRALVSASGIWPAVWLANVFWAPMRELHDRFAGIVGLTPPDYQEQMGRLMDLIEAGDSAAASAHVTRWFARVDAELVGKLEMLLALAAPSTNEAPQNTKAAAPEASPPVEKTAARTVPVAKAAKARVASSSKSAAREPAAKASSKREAAPLARRATNEASKKGTRPAQRKLASTAKSERR